MRCDRGAALGSPTTASTIQAYASRSLEFLHAIENTIGYLDLECQALELSIQHARRLELDIKRLELKRPLDPDGLIAQILSRAMDTASRVYADAKTRKGHAEQDSMLRDEDGVVDAYDGFLEALDGYHDALQDLAEAVAISDAMCSPVSEAYTNAEDLAAALAEAR